MSYLRNFSFVVLILSNVILWEKCALAQSTGVPMSEYCRDEAHEERKHTHVTVDQPDSVDISLNNGDIAESSSKVSLVGRVIESIGSGDIYEEEEYVTSSLPAGGEGVGVYEEPPSETREVLGPDHKEKGEILTDHLESKNVDDINPSEDNKDTSAESLVSQYPSGTSISHGDNDPGLLAVDVEGHDLMKSRIAFTVDSKTVIFTPDTMSLENATTKFNDLQEDTLSDLINPPQKMTMEETIGDVWKEHIKQRRLEATTYLPVSSQSNTPPLSLEHQITPIYQTSFKINVVGDVKDTNYNKLPPKNVPIIRVPQDEEEEEYKDKNQYHRLISKHQNTNLLTTDTTAASLVISKEIVEEQAGLFNLTEYSVNSTTIQGFNVQYNETKETFTSTSNYDLMYDNATETEKHPVAEKLYAFNIETSDVENNLNSNYDNKPEPRRETSILRHLRDYHDKSEEDKVVIKSLLRDHPSFNKEKIEPGVLFEDCPDCDLRILPIRPSEQRNTPNDESESLPPSRIRFADLPEGRELQIYSLGLSDGIFLFSYLSEFLSWIQPNEFPVELLRDALRSQISWVSLITQSLQVEAGFVACLVCGVLLALAVPCVVLSHACYRMGGQADQVDEHQGWAGNCRRRTLVFILLLLLILLSAGMVAMFVTNEQLSGAVVQSSDVLQTSLSDVSAFVHNSHLQLHFLVTQSLDQALQAVYADLDNVDSLLGRPIQQELVKETGLDVALDSLSDLTREAKAITQHVEQFLDEARLTQEMLATSRDKLSDLRQQVELFRRACGPRDRVLCDTIDASGLDIVLRLDRIKSDERLNRMRRMGGVGLEAAALEAKEHFMTVPSKVDSDTRDAREAARRQLGRLRAEVDDKSEGLKLFTRDMTNKVNEAKYQAGFWMQDLDQFEYWRWIICMGGGAAVLMIWTMLLCSLCCGCCGSEKAAGPTILVTIVLVCLFSTVLWTMALVGLLVGGHGEVFVCRPLYDEPDFPVISRLVDQPGVFYSEPHGGFIANVIYGNDSLDVPIKQVLEDCHDNRAIYPTLGLYRVLDVDTTVGQHRWASVSTQLQAVRANLSTLEVLSPLLQDHLADLLTTLSVNFTEHRIQMSKPLTGKDLDSFAKQLDNIGNQMRDLATASRMETLSSRTRRLMESHIRPLEGRKDALVYQLTALEVQTGPLQRQVNQSLSHLKTIQFFINSQGESIAQRKSRQYVDRLLSYLDQMRQHVIETAKSSVAPCRPLWDIFNYTRLFLCRHTMDPLNGYWFATMWCLVVLLIATPVCLKLVDYYRAQGSRSSGSPTDNLVISEQGAGWSSPGDTTETANNENW